MSTIIRRIDRGVRHLGTTHTGKVGYWNVRNVAGRSRLRARSSTGTAMEWQ